MSWRHPEGMEKSKFFDYLLASNRPALTGFKSWLFQPGMTFNSGETWWGEKQPRSSPHEGIDLCRFEDETGKIRQVGQDLFIPATFAGKIIRLARDFLGKSIFLGHEILAADGRQLCTAYGHTRPLTSLYAGQSVAAGEIIAALAAAKGQKARVPPHLHLTLAWIPVTIDPDRLNWRNLGCDPVITLIDPLTVLAFPT
jgi:murein DD-endopeptidase MepM/ murein hydrolase activator NlpD